MTLNSMNQANHINNSEVKGSVYNENVRNIIFPKNRGLSMLCKKVEVDTSGRIIVGNCMLTIPERELNSPMSALSKYLEPLDFGYNFEGLFGGN